MFFSFSFVTPRARARVRRALCSRLGWRRLNHTHTRTTPTVLLSLFFLSGRSTTTSPREKEYISRKRHSEKKFVEKEIGRISRLKRMKASRQAGSVCQTLLGSLQSKRILASAVFVVVKETAFVRSARVWRCRDGSLNSSRLYHGGMQRLAEGSATQFDA